MIAILKLLLKIDHLFGNVGTVFFFETTSLLAFELRGLSRERHS